MPSKKKTQFDTAKLKTFFECKDYMTVEQKKKFLHILKEVKNVNENYSVQTMGVTAPTDHNYLQETDSVTANTISSNVSDWTSVINSNRPINFTDKEKQAVIRYNNTFENDINKNPLYFVNYKISDALSNNANIIIRKHKTPEEQNKFKWVAYKQIVPKTQDQDSTDNTTPDKPMVISDKMQEIQSISFSDDIEGADILNKFLSQLNIPKKTQV